MARPVVFLDRDGTINVDHGFVWRIEDWQYTAGAVPAIARLRRAGLAIAVVTNQSGIARGRYGVADVEALHAWAASHMAKHGAAVDVFAYCPHGTDEVCDCRKPLPGMAKQVEAALGEPIDYARSWMIGDKVSDLGFGAALSLRTVLLRSRYWQPPDLPCRPDHICDTLGEAADHILSNFSSARRPLSV